MADATRDERGTFCCKVAVSVVKILRVAYGRGSSRVLEMVLSRTVRGGRSLSGVLRVSTADDNPSVASFILFAHF